MSGHGYPEQQSPEGANLESLLKLLPQEDLVEMLLGTCEHCQTSIWQQVQQVRTFDRGLRFSHIHSNWQLYEQD
jgi:hypothetical protein